MVVVAVAVSREAEAAGAGVDDVAGEQLTKVHIVTHHADKRRAVVVERRKVVTIAIGPGRGQVFQGDVVERIVIHGSIRRGRGIAVGNVLRHGGEYRHAGFHPGKAAVHTGGLLFRSGNGGVAKRGSETGGRREQQARSGR